MKSIITLTSLLLILISCQNQPKNKEVIIKTRYGNITLELYNETPIHRDNFLKLIKDSFYNKLLFHRVIKEFVIQGGDPDSKNAKKGQFLGDGDLGYTLPAEFRKDLFHKKGVLAAARESDDVNPSKESSAAQFYIVVGKKWTDQELNDLENKRNADEILKNTKNLLKASYINHKTLSADSALKIATQYQKQHIFHYENSHRAYYKNIGGTPKLDGNYTVFGEVKDGMEIVEKIAKLPTDSNDRPIDDIRFTIITK